MLYVHALDTAHVWIQFDLGWLITAVDFTYREQFRQFYRSICFFLSFREVAEEAAALPQGPRRTALLTKLENLEDCIFEDPALSTGKEVVLKVAVLGSPQSGYVLY